jgi:hypothetical protein
MVVVLYHTESSLRAFEQCSLAGDRLEYSVPLTNIQDQHRTYASKYIFASIFLKLIVQIAPLACTDIRGVNDYISNKPLVV